MGISEKMGSASPSVAGTEKERPEGGTGRYLWEGLLFEHVPVVVDDGVYDVQYRGRRGGRRRKRFFEVVWVGLRRRRDLVT